MGGAGALAPPPQKKIRKKIFWDKYVKFGHSVKTFHSYIFQQKCRAPNPKMTLAATPMNINTQHQQC